MKNEAVILLILLVYISFIPVKSQEEISFPDKNLENAIREEIGKTDGEQIYKEDLRRIWKLNLSNKNIIDIEGLQYCTRLYSLSLDNNDITDISPLSNLTNLIELSLNGNNISDISPLSDLSNLKYLYLDGNDISDISPLSDLSNLTVLSLTYNNITDLSPLFDLSNLTELYLGNNNISDISPLAVLTNLKELDLSNNSIHNIFPLFTLTDLRGLNLQRNNIRDITQIKGMSKIGEHEEHWIGAELDLSHNQISDITPLIENFGINEGDEVDISNNPLNSKSLEIYIPVLESRGVELTWEPIKKPTALVKRPNLLLYIPFLAIITISVVICQIKKRKREVSGLKKLLEERDRVKNLLSKLNFQKEELIYKGISENKYNEIYEQLIDRLKTIEKLIEKKQEKPNN